MRKNLEPRTQVRWLCVSIEDGDLQEVQKQLASGCPTNHPDVPKSPLECALERGDVAILDALHGAGAFDDTDLEWMLFVSVFKNKQDAIAIRLLELGANPMAKENVSPRRAKTVFEQATNRGAKELVRAILARVTQGDKDALLVTHVREGDPSCVQELLEAGANAAQQVDGSTLLQLAPAGAEQVLRLLRAVDTGAHITSAMTDTPSSAPPAAPFVL